MVIRLGDHLFYISGDLFAGRGVGICQSHVEGCGEVIFAEGARWWGVDGACGCDWCLSRGWDGGW